jgi:hypothetical protein
MPRDLERNTLYVSLTYSTAVHLCPGCERKVVTPFAPESWHLIFDGETVSISPSIWNKAHECQTHYWIDRDRIMPARWASRPFGRYAADGSHEAGQRPAHANAWFRRLERRLRGLW